MDPISIDDEVEDLSPYSRHHTQTSHWVPPQDSWDTTNGLPYGWEEALDKTGKPYYINHVNRVTTVEDPHDESDFIESPQPREVELVRDPQLGFGFVAGSEKPVIVRFVTDGGPSEDKLLPGDQICEINGEDVKKAPREYVIDLIRSCKESITLTVCQPFSDNSNRKSAILTAAKKARLKSNPSRVRFAEAVTVNGDKILTHPSSHESYVPFMPNVLKVFLENGQTKSFKYDSKTTVKDVLYSLQEKLNIILIEHFALVLQDMRSPTHGKMNILKEDETLSEIASRPGAQHFKCLFRVAFVPKDAYDLCRKDTTAFEYFYLQCCNDVVHGRFTSELKYDVALRLAALHIQQHAISKNITGKLSVKNVEKDCGLEKFVSRTLMDSMKGKDLRKMISHYIKMNHSLAPGQKQLTEIQAKLHYMKIVGELRSFGGRCFMVTLVERKSEAMVLVGPKCGISVVTSIKTNALALIAQFEDIDSIVISKESDSMQRIRITLDESQSQRQTTMLMMNIDVQDFMALVEGYYKLFADTNRNIFVVVPGSFDSMQKENIPQYHGQHSVLPARWSYSEDLDNLIIGSDMDENGIGKCPESERLIDLSKGPPEYSDNIDFLKLKEELGIKSEQFKLGITSRSVHLEVTDAIMSGVGMVTQGFARVRSPRPDRHMNFAQELMEAVNGYDNAQKQRQAEENGFDVFNDANTGQIQDDRSSSSGSSVLLNLQNEDSISSDRQNFEDLNNAEIESKHSMVKSNHLDYNNLQDDKADDVSDAESEPPCELGDGERDPLLQPCKETYEYSKDLSSLPAYLHSESDDTDSYSTPTDSPAKKRLESLNLMPSTLHPLHAESERPQSFGLHSPDQLPRTEKDFKKIAASFGLHSPDQLDQLDDTFKKRVISEGGIYIDTDLIDLTLIPPPKTPDQERLIDFTEAASIPPPGFTDDDNGNLIKEETKLLGPELQLTSLNTSMSSNGEPDREGLDSETDSGNETISSENIELSSTINEFLSSHSEVTMSLHPKIVEQETDIDALIAKLTVPPPPKDILLISLDDPVPPKEPEPSLPLSPAGVATCNSMKAIDEEIASLVIPPPPVSAENSGITADVLPVNSLSHSLSTSAEPVSIANTDVRKSSKDFLKCASRNYGLNSGLKGSTSVKDIASNFSLGVNKTCFYSDQELDKYKKDQNTSMYNVSKNENGLDEGQQTEKPPPPLRVSSLNTSMDNDKKIVILEKPKEIVIVDKTSPLSYANNWVQGVQNNHDSMNESLPYKAKHSDFLEQRRASLRDKKRPVILESVKRPASLDRLQTRPSEGQPTKLTNVQQLNTFTNKGQHNSLISQHVGPTADKSGKFKPKSKDNSDKNTSENDLTKPTSILKDHETDKPVPMPRLKRSASLSRIRSRSPVFSGRSDTGLFLRANSSDQLTSQPLKSSFGQKISHRSSSPDAVPAPSTSSCDVDFTKSCHQRSSSLDLQSPRSPPSSSVPSSPTKANVPVIRSALKPVVSASHAQPRDPSRKCGPMRAIRPQTSKDSDSGSEGGSQSESRSSSQLSQVSASSVMSSPRESPQFVHNKTHGSSASLNLDSSGHPLNRSLDSSTGGSLSNLAKGNLQNMPPRQLSQSLDLSPTQHGSKPIRSQLPLSKLTILPAIRDILDHVYEGDDTFELANQDIETLLISVDATLTSAIPLSKPEPEQFKFFKDSLVFESRQFVTDSKMLVSSTTKTREDLVIKVNASMHTLAKIVSYTQAVVQVITKIDQIELLCQRIREVSEAYRSTLNAADVAVGKTMNDPGMKVLMRQATNLAGVLSSLMKILKGLDDR